MVFGWRKKGDLKISYIKKLNRLLENINSKSQGVNSKYEEILRDNIKEILIVLSKKKISKKELYTKLKPLINFIVSHRENILFLVPKDEYKELYNLWTKLERLETPEVSKDGAMDRRKFLKIAASGTAGTVLTSRAAYGVYKKYPSLQRVKKKVVPFASVDKKFNIPNTMTGEYPPPVRRYEVLDNRSNPEEKIAGLFVCMKYNFNDHIPGGMLLTKDDTRESQIYGRFTSYSPAKTSNKVEKILEFAYHNNKRILIYDEGEGGYVPRIGTLPSARQIGDYLETGNIGKTLQGQVPEEKLSRGHRKRIVRLVIGEYAKELSLRGVDAVYGPILEVPNPKYNNQISNEDRYFSYDFDTTAEIAKIYIEEMHSKNIKVVGKHFITAGLVVNKDLHHSIGSVTEEGNYTEANHIELYRKLSKDLDGVMVTHSQFKKDGNKPYCVSKYAYNLLKHKKSSFEEVIFEPQESHKVSNGINFKNMIFTDEIAMKGLINYIESAKLTKYAQNLLSSCRSTESKASAIAFFQGANIIIIKKYMLDEIVEDLVDIYYKDEKFRNKIDQAFEKYRNWIGTETMIAAR